MYLSKYVCLFESDREIFLFFNAVNLQKSLFYFQQRKNIFFRLWNICSKQILTFLCSRAAAMKCTSFCLSTTVYFWTEFKRFWFWYFFGLFPNVLLAHGQLFKSFLTRFLSHLLQWNLCLYFWYQKSVTDFEEGISENEIKVSCNF